MPSTNPRNSGQTESRRSGTPNCSPTIATPSTAKRSTRQRRLRQRHLRQLCIRCESAKTTRQRSLRQRTSVRRDSGAFNSGAFNSYGFDARVQNRHDSESFDSESFEKTAAPSTAAPLTAAPSTAAPSTAMRLDLSLAPCGPLGPKHHALSPRLSHLASCISVCYSSLREGTATFCRHLIVRIRARATSSSAHHNATTFKILLLDSSGSDIPAFSQPGMPHLLK